MIRLQSQQRGQKKISDFNKTTRSTRSHSRNFHHKNFDSSTHGVPRWLCGEPHFDVTGSALINRCTINLLQNIAVCVNSRLLAFERFLKVIAFFHSNFFYPTRETRPGHNAIGNDVPYYFSVISVWVL